MGDDANPAMKPTPVEQAIFAEALLRDTPEARLAYLAAACGADEALRQRVEALLRAAENAGDFLETPPTGLGNVAEATLDLGNLSEQPGDRIGRYKLLQQIGEGGCGVVYMAEQEEPVRRRVALKVIKLGMDTKSVIARFEAERQALALMDHPNIAKVLDAGATENGRPYFVMELVRGIKITEFCDQNNLSTEERLKLFTQVCHAIQHAHQKGIIHRDIKPSNILVTQNEKEAVPKVIDFGIAKATTNQRLTDKTVFTAFEQFIGTPAYMSPEQAMMTSLDIDTRTDIYALGVLLYELLTGTTPFDANDLMAAGLDAMRRTIREQEPARPSTKLTRALVAAEVTRRTGESAGESASSRRRLQEVAHQLKGDLDWIVMKALEKDRTRRYETANGLAMDIQRHLSNEPVTARPPSRLYEFQKTVRRHKFGFAAAAALILVLGLGVLASSWQALRARRAEREQIKLRQEAESEVTRSQQVAKFMQDMLNGVGPSAALGRDTAMLREILDRTAERIATDLKGQPNVEAELRNTIGTVYWQLGEFDKAAGMHRQALAIQRKLFGNENPGVATSLHHLAEALRQQRRLDESETAFRESLAIRRRLLGNEHPDVAQSLNYLGSLLSIELKDDEPETLLREAVSIRRKVLGHEHGDVGTSLDNLAHVLNRRGKVEEAIAMHYEAMAIRKKFFGGQHPELVYSYLNLAGALQGQGQFAEAELMLRNAESLCNKLLGQQHPTMPRIRQDLASVLRKQGKLQEAEALTNQPDTLSESVASALHEAGRFFQQKGRLTEAAANYREAVALKKQRWGNDSRETAVALGALGLVLRQERKLAEAELVGRELLAVERKLSGNEHPLVAACLHEIALVLYESDRASEAEALFREAAAMRTALLGRESIEVADSVLGIGISLARQGKHAEAETAVRAALSIGRKTPTAENWVANALLVLGYELRELGKLTEAEAACREAVAIRRKLFGNEHLELAYAIHRLAWILNQPGKRPEAEALAREELSMRRKLLSHEHPEVILSWKLLGELLTAQGKAMELQALTREQPGAENSATEMAQSQFAYLLWQVGNAWLQQEQFKDAERTFEQALQKFKQLQVRFPTNPYYRQEQAFSLRSLSDVRQRAGRMAEAEASLQTALTIYQQLVNDIPASSFYRQEVAVIRGRIAEVLVAQGRSAEAEAICREELARQQKQFGEVHRAVDLALASLGRVLHQGGKLAEAETVLREELAMERKLSGDEHPFVANSLSLLAPVVRDLGKLDEAEALYREALAMRRKLLPPEHTEIGLTLGWLAVVLGEQGKLAELEICDREILVSKRKLYGDKHLEVGSALAQLTTTLLAQNKFTDAEPLARECLAIREAKLPDDWRTFNARGLLGVSLLGLERYAEAEPLLLAGYAGMKQREATMPAAGKPRLTETIRRLVQLYEQTGRPIQLAEWKQQLALLDQATIAKDSGPPKP